MSMHRYRVLQGNANRNSNCVFKKLAILEEEEQTGSIKITARKQKFQKIPIMNWSLNKEILIEKSSAVLLGTCITEFSQYTSHLIQFDAHFVSVIGWN